MSQIREITDAEHALEVQNLSYRFKNHKALDEVSFTVAPGSLCAANSMTLISHARL